MAPNCVDAINELWLSQIIIHKKQERSDDMFAVDSCLSFFCYSSWYSSIKKSSTVLFIKPLLLNFTETIFFFNSEETPSPSVFALMSLLPKNININIKKEKCKFYPAWLEMCLFFLFTLTALFLAQSTGQ